MFDWWGSITLLEFNCNNGKTVIQSQQTDIPWVSFPMWWTKAFLTLTDAVIIINNDTQMSQSEYSIYVNLLIKMVHLCWKSNTHKQYVETKWIMHNSSFSVQFIKLIFPTTNLKIPATVPSSLFQYSHLTQYLGSTISNTHDGILLCM